MRAYSGVAPQEVEAGISGRSSASHLYRLGFLSVVALALALPFDLAARPLFVTRAGPLTDLSVLVSIVVVLAVASLLVAAIRALWCWPEVVTLNVSPRRLARVLYFLLALVATSAVSGVAAHRLDHSLPWILNLLAGGFLCIALPLWLGGPAELRMTVFARALIAGAVVAALVGFGELWLGPGLERCLAWFRPSPTTMGPYLRLTSSFHHANEAAMYFNLALPFALVGLGQALRRGHAWKAVAAWAITVDVLLMALLLTYSRGGLLGLAASLFAMGFARRRALLRPSFRHVAAVGFLALLPVGAFLAATLPIDILRFTAQGDASWYRVGYASAVPGRLSVGERRVVPVTVGNLSPLAWISTTSHDYGLSYHWLYPSWKVAQFNTAITWIRGRIDPGRTRTLRAAIQPPSRPGRYLLVWDVLWHGSTWFGLKFGAYRPHSVRVLPGPARASGRTQNRERQPAPESFTTLPFSQTADRTQIWRVALQEIARHPLLGSGPHGFRRQYKVFIVTPRHGRVRPPDNAHNLVLELLADWGVVGGVAFLLLVLVLWQPLCAAAVRGAVSDWWQVAILGAGVAFVAHSAVEFFLGTPAILFAWWLLCGLALATTARTAPSVQPG